MKQSPGDEPPRQYPQSIGCEVGKIGDAACQRVPDFLAAAGGQSENGIDGGEKETDREMQEFVHTPHNGDTIRDTVPSFACRP